MNDLFPGDGARRNVEPKGKMKPETPKKPKYMFEIYRSVESPESEDYAWYWRCRHRNGQIIADGAEGYSSKDKLRRSLVRFIFGVKTNEYEILATIQ